MYIVTAHIYIVIRFKFAEDPLNTVYIGKGREKFVQTVNLQ